MNALDRLPVGAGWAGVPGHLSAVMCPQPPFRNVRASEGRWFGEAHVQVAPLQRPVVVKAASAGSKGGGQGLGGGRGRWEGSVCG